LTLKGIIKRQRYNYISPSDLFELLVSRLADMAIPAGYKQFMRTSSQATVEFERSLLELREEFQGDTDEEESVEHNSDED
jgi:hypothetical protein